ncbi:MAG: hypothetical protein QM737_13720 [Ferruginibacter sp.]
MKKVILGFFSLLTISVASNAQTAAPAKKEAKMETKAKAASPTDDKMKPAPAEKRLAKPKADKAATTAAPAKSLAPAAAATPAPAATNAVTPLKKDGTPDKRFKAKKATPVKKDGTPDMRYKENKDAKPKN